MSPRIAALLAALAASGCLHHEPLVERGRASDVLVFRDVRVFAGNRLEADDHQDVVVRGARIESVRPTGGPVEDGAFVVEGGGRTLLPGLVDFHVHLVNTSSPPWDPSLPDTGHNLEGYLYAGVTAVCDMAGPVGQLGDLADEVESGERLGPRIFFAGPMLGAPGGHPEAILEEALPWPVSAVAAGRIGRPIETPQDGVLAVEDLARDRVTLVKVAYDSLPTGAPQLDRERLLAIVETAHARGLKVAVHVRKAPDALTSALYRADALAHGVSSSPFPPRLATELARTGIFVCPTMISRRTFDDLASGVWQPSSLGRRIEHRKTLEALLSPDVPHRMRAVGRGFWSFVSEIAAHRATASESVRAMYEAGVPLLAGTDSPLVGNIPGASLHQELRLLAGTGVPNAEILLAATSRPARFLDPGGRWGRIEPGCVADLLLVEGNPLEDIGATEAIVGVWRKGAEIRRRP